MDGQRAGSNIRDGRSLIPELALLGRPTAQLRNVAWEAFGSVRGGRLWVKFYFESQLLCVTIFVKKSFVYTVRVTVLYDCEPRLKI